MKDRHSWFVGTAVAAAAFSLSSMLPNQTQAAQITIQAADPTQQGDGTMSPAAQRAMTRGALPKSAEEETAKAALTAAAMRGRSAGPSTDAPAEAPPSAAPVTTRSFEGIFQPNSAPSDSTGAVGPNRYIELVNTNFAIYNKTSNTPIATGTLNELAGQAPTVNSFDPQIIWDAQTNRFYYLMDSIFSATDNKLAFGFSKNAAPNSAADFCHYQVNYGAAFPDYPKVGDSQHFLIIGVNTFAPGFVGSDIMGISKPPAGTTCPDVLTFKFGIVQNIKDSAGTT